MLLPANYGRIFLMIKLLGITVTLKGATESRTVDKAILRPIELISKKSLINYVDKSLDLLLSDKHCVIMNLHNA